MPRQSSDSNSERMIANFLTASMGTLISLSPVIVIESSFSLEVALILLFLNNVIVIDDWWTTVSSMNEYVLETPKVVTMTIVYHNALIFLTVWIFAAGKRLVPLSGYLFILFVISLMDLIWCQFVLDANRELERDSVLMLRAWKETDLIIAFVYLVGFLLLHLLGCDPLICALVFVSLYIVGAVLEEAIIRFDCDSSQ